MSRVDRVVLVIGIVSVVAGLRHFVRLSEPVNLVTVPAAAAVAFGALGVLAIVAAVVRMRPLVVAVGAAFLAAAVVWLVVTPFTENWLGADGSTFALLAGLGVGLAALGLTPGEPATPTREAHVDERDRAA